MSLLAALQRSNALRSLDQALARSLQRLRPDTPDAVLAGAALASLAVAQGHAGLDPRQPQRLLEAGVDWPPGADWLAQLGASAWVDMPASQTDAAATDAPLVLENGLLYLRRYREYERRLAEGLQRIASHRLDAADPATLAALFGQLFPQARDSIDHQARAAAVALRHPLVLVTGGPGTGKTTTIARLLVLLAAQAVQVDQPLPRVALAAPTGRAAERMAESLRLAVQRLRLLGIAPALCDAMPGTGTTLHRLLGVIPDSPRFRHHGDNPLPFEVVVVDEASMIDLPLMAKLVEAIASGTRLVLLGDPDQLPSVEAGDVLSAILHASGDGLGTQADDAQALRPLLAPAALQPLAAPIRFAGRRVQLQRGYRQTDALDLAALAQAVRQGDSATTLALLRGGTLAGVHFHEDHRDPLQHHQQHLLAHWRALGAAADPGQALADAGRIRLLTALREGPQGARGLNARIEALLAGVPRPGLAPGYFHGRLLLITENSYRHRLFNGDIGICLADRNGAVTAWFPGETPDQPRGFHPGALPAHESAFAMTVHKAQGSEFDEVWLQLPRQDNGVLSRELVYTGITRARQSLHVLGGEEVIIAALKRHASRVSGLAMRLQGHKDPAVQDSAAAPIDSAAVPPPAQGRLF
ncbi:exodeoxyribonuclease V subunit alpha [Stenotrophomonas rhizophila]|uniref:exodeoxyribonuclease V subunit alpha n=1 Tax=Stenotrophomonas rhizophila TaxID=216778 RepID=UPI001E31FADA|nr:exodeoxyribonuclease V subunit alpha [Stenotrophomonas rhizophila]MCC7633366.1 exodeoxyribonuclease V subunit alpha [Stenotrophomonas rhizophila]MCC7662257.1 exodeoxyribonuclease V subunit alpha [Stenotrophomonas rhizophila]